MGLTTSLISANNYFWSYWQGGYMNLKGIGAIYDKEDPPPDCVLEAPIDQRFFNLNEFKSVMAALWFESGPADNPTARSYVFYFYRGEIDHDHKPDDILTFKVKFEHPDKVYIIDKYLGGMSYGAINAPPLSKRQEWWPGKMSVEGKNDFLKGLK
jgi:hypothetical protein